MVPCGRVSESGVVPRTSSSIRTSAPGGSDSTLSDPVGAAVGCRECQRRQASTAPATPRTPACRREPRPIDLLRTLMTTRKARAPLGGLCFAGEFECRVFASRAAELLGRVFAWERCDCFRVGWVGSHGVPLSAMCANQAASIRRIRSESATSPPIGGLFSAF